MTTLRFRSHHTATVPWEDGTPTSWKLQAACAEYGVTGDDDPWFSIDPNQRAVAVRICQACPVRADCYTDAERRGETHGIRGGVEWAGGQPSPLPLTRRRGRPPVRREPTWQGDGS